MAIEYSHDRDDTIESICKNAPAIWVENVNKARLASGRSAVSTRGVSNSSGTKEQQAHNLAMLNEKLHRLTRERCARLLAEAKSLHQS